MNFKELLSGKVKIILASQSLRRRQLLEEIGLSFELKIKEVDESYPAELQCENVVRYIAEKKSNAFENKEIPAGAILITADTIVWLDGGSLLKPKDEQDAIEMLGKLSGRKHRVATGVCLRSTNKRKVFHVLTDVCFKTLSLEERTYYVQKYKPYDKSGSYGIQEWIGLTGIERIEGSYTNVMGLPMKELYEELLKF
ncbi:MAG TPA: Maf family nucleotide pyrophosphatase [Bacteroidia bacterium]|jgi:septum formation protein|nr:Maf family nucleotide pyrophosphatase [Bacteroidia bacterium]